MSARSGSLSAALEPLFEIVETLSAEVRLTVLSIRDDALEIVGSKGADPLLIGTTLTSPVMGAFRERLQDDGPFIINIADDELPEDTRQVLGQFSFEHAFVVPLHSFDDVTECVVVDEPGRRMSFEGPRLKLLSAAVAQARVALENEDLRIQAAKREVTLETIVRLGIAFGSVHELDQTAAQVVDYAAMLLDVPAFVLLFRGEGAPDFEVLAAEGLPPGASHLKVTPIEVAGLEANQAGNLAVGGLPPSAKGSLFEALELAGLTHTLMAPMVVGDGRLRGVLLGLDRRRLEPSSEERDAFHLLSMQAANAIWSAELFEAEHEAQRRARLELATTRMLHDVAIAASSSSTVAEVCERALSAAAEHLDVIIGSVYMFNAARNSLDRVASLGMSDDLIAEFSHLDVRTDSSGLVALAARELRLVASEDVPASKSKTRLLAKAGIESSRAVAMPLETKGVLLGTLSFVYASQGAFTEDEREVLRSIGRIISPVFESMRLFEAQCESARLSQALNDVNRAVHSTLEIDEVMQHALDAGVEALTCDSGAIEISEGSEWVVRYQTGFSSKDIGMRLSREEAANSIRAERERTPFQVEVLSAEEKANVGFVKEYGLKSVLALPLFARGEVTGCALFYTSKDVRIFTDSEIDFGRKLGSVVSLGLENARLYSLERNTAETLQRALLTLPESLRGIEFATSYRSATESTLVGGDFYDIFELDDDRIGITIGDISGKGLGAAVLTSLVKDTIRAHANERDKTPAQVLTLTNDLVHRSTPTDAFATVFFAILDRQDGRLSFANAGHTTAAIMKSGGPAAKLPVTDPILGAFASIEFCESETQLKPGEILFLYTDGLTEARKDRKFYGEERLFELLVSSRRTSVTDVVADVMDDVMTFASGRLRDDLAILAVRRLSAGVPES